MRRLAAKGNPFKSANFVSRVNVVVGAEGSNAINVAIRLQSANAVDIAAAGHLLIYLADDAAGQILAASAPSSGWAVGTDGTLLVSLTSNKAAIFVSEADGDLDITITEATAKTFYLCICLPDGSIDITPIVFA